MAFRTRAPIDPNQHKGLVVQNANGLGGVLIPTGRSLTSAIPVDVSIVDSAGNQITSFGNSTFGAAFPSQGMAIGAIDASGNMAGLNLDSHGNLDTITPDTTVSGNITSTESVTLACNGIATAGVQITGTWTGTLAVEGTVDGSNYNSTTAAFLANGQLVSNITANAIYQVNLSGLKSFRIRGNTVASGTAVVTIIGNATSAMFMLDNPLPAGSAVIGALATGTNNIGNVGTKSASVNVGQTTSNATAQQLNGGTSIAATNGILVQALAANTNNVYIGGSGVTSSTGYELQPGQAAPFTCSNINALYVVGGTGSDKVCWSVL